MLQDKHQKDFQDHLSSAVALLSESVSTDKVDHTPLVVELGDLRVRVGVDEACRPVEVLRLDVLRGDAELKTTGHHLCDVGRTDDRTTDTLRDHGPHFIEVTTGVGIEGEAEAIIEEPCVEASVELVLLFVGQVSIAQLLDTDPRLLVFGQEAEGDVRLEDRRRAAIGGVWRRPREAIGETEREVAQWLELLEEVFLVHVPCARDVPRRHPASIAAAPELIRAFVAVGAVDDIAPLIGVGRIAVEGYRTIVRVVEVVVAIAVLYLLLEVLVGVEGRLSSGVLKPPAREGGAVTLDIGRLKTAEEVERVDSEGTVIVRRSTEVIVAHAVLTLVHEATIG